jgi:HPt (histidine-containing phosphotransfer) domain-containing protein
MNDPGRESGLDRQFALSRVGGDEELLKEIAAVFVADYPNSLREIRAAIDSGDASLLERSAHSLKGSVANFGARDAVASALRLEQMGRARQMRDCAGALQELEQALASLRPQLAAL